MKNLLRIFIISCWSFKPISAPWDTYSNIIVFILSILGRNTEYFFLHYFILVQKFFSDSNDLSIVTLLNDPADFYRNNYFNDSWIDQVFADRGGLATLGRSDYTIHFDFHK